jgi:hypothetical protein
MTTSAGTHRHIASATVSLRATPRFAAVDIGRADEVATFEQRPGKLGVVHTAKAFIDLIRV